MILPSKNLRVEIARSAYRIASADLSDLQKQALSCALNLDYTQHIAFQEVLPHAVEHGWVSMRDADLVIDRLGESPACFNGQQLHVKVQLTRLFENILCAVVRQAQSTDAVELFRVMRERRNKIEKALT